MKKFLVAGMVGILLVTGTACNNKQPQKTNAAAATAKTEQKQTVEVFGVVKAPDVKNIILDFSAAIAKVNIRDGQKVKSGDSLIILDLTDYQSQISSKERQLNSENLELQRLINTTMGDQKELKRLQTDVNTKQDALRNNTDPDLLKALNTIKTSEDLYAKALQELSSKESLFKSGALSQYDLDEFKKSVEAKKKAVDDAKYELEIVKSAKQKSIDELLSQVNQKLTSLDNTQSGIDINKIKIQREKIAGLESEIKQMKDKINKSYLKQNDLISDVQNAVVYDIGYQQGDIIDSKKKVLSIMNLDSMIVEANVPEEFIKDVKVGAEVTIIPQADKSKSYTGKVANIADKAIQKNNETNIAVQITLDNKDGFLLPDFNVDVKINMSKK